MIRIIALTIGGGLTAAALADGFPESPPTAPVQRHITMPQPVRHTLDNGLELIVIRSDEIPWVSINWYLEAGAAHDAPDKSGVAELTASLLREGTPDHDSSSLAEILDSAAIRLTGSADHYTTTVQANCLSAQGPTAVRWLAEVIRRPTFPEKDFVRIQRQTAQGLSVTEKDGAFQAEQALTQWLYGAHFLARPAGGTSHTIKRIERTDVVGFHKTHYMPNRSTLIFSGDITPERALELTRTHFADWARGTPAPVTHPAVPTDEATRIVLIDRSDAEQTQIRIGQMGFSRTDPDYAVSQLFNEVFGNNFVSRLNRRIRVQEGLTYGARGAFDAGRAHGTLRVSTFTRPERVGQTVHALLDEIRKIRDHAPTLEELTDAKSALVGGFGLSMETPQDVARRVWSLKFHELPPNYYATFFDQVDGVSAVDVQKFAQRRVHPDGLKIVVVGRADEVQSQLESVAPVTVIKPGQPIPPAPAAADPG